MKVVDQKNFWAGLMYLALGVAVSIWSIGFEIGTASAMGPGYFPLMVGLALVATGLVVAIGSFNPGAVSTRIGNLHLKPVLIVAGAVVAFGLLIQAAGLAVAVPALVLISAFADPKRSWSTVLMAIAVLLPLSWLIFVQLLGLQLQLLPSFVGV